MSDKLVTDAIAIIGIACRFPGAADKDMFWKNLQSGKDVLTTFTEDELLENGVSSETLENSDYVRHGYPIDDIEMFDASLFGYSPAEAKRIDPQQRLFLQCAWTALEDAGYAPDSRLHTGVFASAKMSTYQNALSDPNTIGTSAAFASVLGNDKDYIATRTSFKLGLTGPSFAVQTACSSSLAATHLAVESLISGECDMALAGGVSISIPQRVGYTYEEGMICAPDAKCRAFDKDAAGICASNGVGVVLLKPLENAVDDGDNIYAVIRGSAMNNDGANKAGFTAPSVSGQYNVIRDALSVAEESADNVSYVETHGTGTLLGDPIEIQSLTKAYREDTDASGYCAIGSVKTNVGHLDTAAGVCSLIKTALALHHEEIPATLHFSTPNPHIPFAATPFFPIANSTAWKKRNDMRLAGVSSFGVGGTNVHLIVQSAADIVPLKKRETHPDAAQLASSDAPFVLPLSANDADQLNVLRNNVAQHLLEHPDVDLPAVMHTLFKGRKHFAHRVAVSENSIEKLAEALRAAKLTSTDHPPKIGMIFTGQGCQYTGMGKALFDHSTVFKNALLRIENALADSLPYPLTELLFNETRAEMLDHTSITQPAIFAVQYALAEYWKSLGVVPVAVTGHSIGEFAAACVAGIMTPEDAAQLIARRGELTGSLPQGGGMLAVLAKEEDIHEILSSHPEFVLDIAAYNGIEHIVLAGITSDLQQVKVILEESGFFCKLLSVSHAFHSRFLDPVLDDFRAATAALNLSKPVLPYISSFTGKKEGTLPATPKYWVSHLRNPVQFVGAMCALCDEGCDVILEAGPHPILIGMAKKFIESSKQDSIQWISSMRRENGTLQPTYDAIASLYQAGVQIRCDTLVNGAAKQVPLPTYPFKKEKYWEPRTIRSSAEYTIPAVQRGDAPFYIAQVPHPTSTFTAEIGLDTFPALENHCINGELVAPLGILTELLAQVWAAYSGEKAAVSIAEITLHAPVLLDAAIPQTIHVLPQENGSISVQQQRGDVWVSCMSAVVTAQRGTLSSISISGASKAFSKQDLPKVLRGFGSDKHGDALWTFTNAMVGSSAISANILLHDKLLSGAPTGADKGAMTVHPSLIDPCIQLLGGFVDLFTDETGAPCILLPTSLQASTTYGSHSNQVHCDIQLLEKTERVVSCDVQLRTPEGVAIVELHGLSLIKIPSDAQNALHNSISPYTRLVWKKAENVLDNKLHLSQKSKVADKQDVESASALELAPLSTDFTFVSAPTEVEKLASLFPSAQIVDVTNIQTVCAEKVLFYVEGSTVDIIVETMAALASSQKMKELVLVTHHAIRINDAESVNPDQRMAWELGRVFMSEHPSVVVKMLDVDDISELQAIPVSSKLSQYALRNKQWHLPCLVGVEKSLKSNILAPVTSTTTLVTGGTGGLGIELITQLVSEGHKNILVTARSEPKAHVAAVFDTLRKKGADIVFESADIANAKDVQRVLAPCGSSLPPLGAVFHLAGQTSNSSLCDLTADGFAVTSNAKIVGAALLDEYTRAHPVERFVLFSSISTLHGIPAAGVYTASNGYLEAMAELRQQDGLAATCICWGPFADCGMLSHDIEGHRVRETLGINAWSSEALSYLREFPNETAVCTLADIDWVRFSQALESAETPLAFAVDNFSVPQPVETTTDVSARSDSTGISTDNLEENITRSITQLLQVSVAPARNENLLMAGLDSLLFLQLSQKIRKTLEVRITPAEVFANPTIENICNIISGKLLPEMDVEEPEVVLEDSLELGEAFPLTDTQYAYWAGRSETMPMGNISCHSYAEYDVESLDLAKYNEAWDALIKRHPMLRMIITDKGQQQILPKVQSLHIAHEDLSTVADEEQQVQMERVRNMLSHKVHDTSCWPLFTVQTVQLPNDVTRICMSIDLLLADASSLQILMRELRDVYSEGLISSVTTGIKKLPTLEYTFQKYIADAQEFAASDDGGKLLSAAESYWDNRLEYLPHGPELPICVAPEAIKVPRFTHRSYVLKKSVWSALKKRAQAHGLTPSLLLLSAYADVLARWSHSKAFCLNVTLFNRQPFNEQVREIVGDFTTLSLLEISNNPAVPFIKRAAAVRDQFWTDMEHTSLSGVEVIRKLTRSGKLPFGESYPVVFTSNISGGNASDVLLEALGTRGFNISQTPQVWLDNQVHEDKGDLIIHWDSVDELFPENLIEEMLSAYGLMLMQLAGSDACWQQNAFDYLPQRTLATLEAMNATSAPCSAHNLWSLFVKQYNSAPDAIAIITPNDQISYGELGARAAGFARELTKRGATQKTLVGISLPKSIDQVAAALATQAIGAVFVPIDHEQPAIRKQTIAQESMLSLVIACEAFDPNITHISPSLATDSLEHYEGPKSVEDLAYIIFTSGSTGKPKGVSITHKAAVNTLLDINKRYDISNNDVVFGVSRLTFDLAIYDIFGAFAAGATLVLPEDSRQKDPAHWIDCLALNGCTVWNSAPALMQLAIQYAQTTEKTFPALRLAMLSGDKIVPDLPQNLHSIAPNVETHSLGGATEASIWSICYPIGSHKPEHGPVPYGRPMANQQWYVLDSALEPCPEHVIGDLYIGGTGLAQGYYGRDDLTKKAFITHPVTGKRIYRTGDMGTLNPQGHLTIIGRRDFQVKIRGHRVEPSEIEHVLSKHPTVSHIVVLPIIGQNGMTLAAYYSGSASKQELTVYATEQLPRYMVPAYYVSMDIFPMTPSGKVDRKKLPKPDVEIVADTKQENAELTPLQEAVAEVWNELLQQEFTPVDMDFFNAGGDSVLAAQLVLGIRGKLGITLALPRLFENPTIGLLSQHILESHPDVDETLRKRLSGENTEASKPKESKPDKTTSIVDIVHVDILKKHPVCKYVPTISHPPHGGQNTFTHPFLTGATGFLGIHVLKSLLQNDVSGVTCLVRATGKDSGLKRILDTAEVYGFSLERFKEKIQIITGDLSLQYFGLEEDQFLELSNNVDAVFHAGALVHYIYSCESLLGPNVIGTREAIRLASTGNVKPLHHVSTVSVFSPLRSSDDLLILEDEQIEQDMDVFGGYPQSKWLAERLVQNAINAGLPAYIYRPGLITGTSSKGIWNKEDFLWRVIRGSLKAGVIPDLERVENFLPVDTVAEALVHISRGTLEHNVYHLDGFNPVSSRQLVEELRQVTSALQVVPYAQWRKAIAQPENPLYPLLPLLPDDVNPESISRQFRFDNSNARKALQGSAVHFPALETLLPVYMQSMLA
ncbi:MAG: amino acid adenylation domain-containing protein [Halodesulfovibrio sp.]|uniref:amino acid adenylation domain-containing protein n=1 Tax=Halodesulfovibrio sp. TaxID=1912772 RepID=UPI00359E31CC